MFTRLRQPGGALGGISVVATLVFAIVGLGGFVSMLVDLAADGDLWSRQGDRVFGSVLFGLMIVGAVGFLIMDRQPMLGAALAIVGCIALAISVFWTVVPVVLGIVFAVAAIKRAQLFQQRAIHT